MTTDSNVGRWLTHRAQRTPGLDAFVQAETGLRLSYAELNARCNRSAHLLQEAGVRRGDRVALLLENGPEIFECLLAIAKLGAVAVPLNWRLVCDELSTMLLDSGAELLLYSESFDALADELHSRGRAGSSVRYWIRAGHGSPPRFARDYAASQSAASSSEPESSASEDDDFLILYTSGTTGAPKGAVHSHRSAIWGVLCADADLDYRYRDAYLLFMPAFHVGALLPFLGCIRKGITLVTLRTFDAEQAWASCERERISQFIAVPTMLQAMLEALEQRPREITSVRWILTGGAPIPESLLEAYSEREIRLVSAYGLTEAFGQGCVLLPDCAEANIGSVGQTSFHLESRVVDAAGRDCPPDVPGELLLRGPCVMKGYWGRPEETTETLRGGWLHTGDVATRTAEGLHTLCDRIKDMIISGGENIYPAELEKLLHSHPQLADVAVIGQPSARWGESPFVIAVKSHPGLEEREVLEWLEGKIARFKHPKGVAFVDALPRNAAGKLRKPLLRERFPGPASEL